MNLKKIFKNTQVYVIGITSRYKKVIQKRLQATQTKVTHVHNVKYLKKS